MEKDGKTMKIGKSMKIREKSKRYWAMKVISFGFGTGAIVCLAFNKIPLIFACAAMAVIFSFAASKGEK